ncbi:hypothetical protein [Helicobacter acinonychis]|nr:hypothetical protein [Helicobacter acinonychis]
MAKGVGTLAVGALKLTGTLLKGAANMLFQKKNVGMIREQVKFVGMNLL